MSDFRLWDDYCEGCKFELKEGEEKEVLVDGVWKWLCKDCATEAKLKEPMF